MLPWQFITTSGYNTSFLFPLPYYRLIDSRHIIFIALCTLQQEGNCLNWILGTSTLTFSLSLSYLFWDICLTTHPFKIYKSVGFSIYIQSQASIITINFRTFSLLSKETSHPLALTTIPHPQLFLLLSPRQPLIYCLSLKICLSWTFYINGII